MTTIPGIFLSHDGYLSAAIFTLRQYARVWPDCPIRFIVPTNSDAAAQRIRKEAPKGLHVDVIQSELSIRATLANLDQAAGDAEWVYWCSSDRYPIAAAPEALNAIAADLAAGSTASALSDYQALRVVRWKDIAVIDDAAAPVSVGGNQFRGAQMTKVGFWHPQFMRRSWLRELISVMSDSDNLLAMQKLIDGMKDRNPLRPAICDKSLMKLEEPIRKGKATLNYAARQARKGGDIDGLAIEGVSVAYSCIRARQANPFWEGTGVEPALAIKRLLPGVSPFRVVSPGGVGSKRIATWLYGDGPPEMRSRAHSHRRIPPRMMREGERCLYVFGDPRNIVLSIFNRRQVRHERHGFLDVNALRAEPAPDFAMKHARNLEAAAAPMTEEWDLAEYLKAQFDAFRLEEHFDFWLWSDLPYEVVFVRYETVWRHAEALRAYMGVARPMPEFRERVSDWKTLETEQRERMDKLHGSFARRLEALPDLFRVTGGTPMTLAGEPLRFESV